MTTRTCKRCGESKPLELFKLWYSGDGKGGCNSGYSHTCLVCAKLCRVCNERKLKPQRSRKNGKKERRSTMCSECEQANGAHESDNPLDPDLGGTLFELYQQSIARESIGITRNAGLEMEGE